MKVTTVKFNPEDQPEFFSEVRRRVNRYFRLNRIEKQGNIHMKLKSAFMLSLYFVPMIFMYAGLVTAPWMILVLWGLMGFGMSGIGLSIMHDANHRSYSKNQRVNNALSVLSDFLGAFHINWRIQHNVLHHSFTNVHEFDEDISNPAMRFSPNQKRKKFNKFQAFYAPFLYSIMTLYWLARDYKSLNRYNKEQLLQKQGISFKKAILQMSSNKVAYILVTLVLPMIIVPVPWWLILIGFIIMHLICGLLLSLIFQPAHVIEKAEFVLPDENGSVENHWAIHQMKTTANFANGSRLFTWFVGGLNHQIEHHLFPNICHVHYRRIARIVKNTAKEFSVPYHHHKTFFHAVKSHFAMLHLLGTGKYDRIAG